MGTRSSGAARITTFAMATRPRRQLQLTLTIAPPASKIGWQAGGLPRRPGAALTMAKAARSLDASQPGPLLHLSIVRPASPTGSLAGVWLRRPGAAPMPARVAQPRAAAALDQAPIM